MSSTQPHRHDELGSSAEQTHQQPTLGPVSQQPHKQWDYGGNPLAQLDSGGTRLGPSLGELRPGLYKQVKQHKTANAAPLGLAGFALTTFLLSIINLNVRGATVPNIVVGPAIAYGGIVQLLAGMWEVAAGNTFAAWALSSYGGFWISLGITFTPSFSIAEAYGGETPEFYEALALYLYGWMIFTFVVWLATLRSTVVFSLLILCVALTFLALATGYILNNGQTPATPHPAWNKAGGGLGIVAAFLAWWAMYSGVADRYNSFFLVPVFPFPWSPEGRKSRGSVSKHDIEKID